MTRDSSLDTLLDLDGVSYVVNGPYWVKFDVKRVPETPEKPHGLDYSLTLHDGDGRRVMGFDNAHASRENSGPGAQTRIAYDHTHQATRVRFYDYTNAVTLLNDFWTEVDRVLAERTTKP